MRTESFNEQQCLEAILEEDARVTQLLIEQNEFLARIAASLENLAAQTLV